MRRDLHAGALELYGNEEAAALNTQLLGPLITDARLDRRISALRAQAGTTPLKGPGRTGFAELVAAGMARLDAPDQEALFDVKAALADKSPALCASFWTGNVSGTQFSVAMRALDIAHQRTWITLSARALTRELEADGAPPPAPSGAGPDAMAELIQSLSPEERAAFAAADAGSSEPVACGAFRALAAGVRNISGEKRAAVLRMLSGAASGSR